MSERIKVAMWNFCACAAFIVLFPTNARAAVDEGDGAMQGNEPLSVRENSPTSEAASPASWSVGRALRWLGKLHVLVIHFPVALLTVAGIAQVWWSWRRQGLPSPAMRFCVLLGAATSVASVLLGWLHADWGGYGAESPVLLRSHRWAGTALAVWAVLTAIVSERDVRAGRRSAALWILLGICAALTGAVAHLGGSLVHGADFLLW